MLFSSVSDNIYHGYLLKLYVPHCMNLQILKFLLRLTHNSLCMFYQMFVDIRKSINICLTKVWLSPVFTSELSIHNNPIFWHRSHLDQSWVYFVKILCSTNFRNLNRSWTLISSINKKSSCNDPNMKKIFVIFLPNT